MELKNSTVLITGGTSGIGLEFVKQLTALGATIIVTGRDEAKLEKAKKHFPNIHTFKSDASKPEDIKALFQQVTTQFPKLNVLINNAGIMREMDVQDESMALDYITMEIETNLSGLVRMVHQFLPHLKKQSNAAIVNISSGLAFVPFSISPVYSATKAGVHSYTQALRLQLQKTHVKVFELAPPGTDTPLMDQFEGTVDPNQNMKVDKMVAVGIKGILNDKLEIRPGLANVLKMMGRIAPNFMAGILHKTVEKAKAKASK